MLRARALSLACTCVTDLEIVCLLNHLIATGALCMLRCVDVRLWGESRRREQKGGTGQRGDLAMLSAAATAKLTRLRSARLALCGALMRAVIER